MALDTDIIINEFIRVAKEGVGSRLAQIGTDGNQFPAVIRANQGGPILETPNIHVNILKTSETGGWMINEGVDENNQPYRETQYKLLIRYTVFGEDAVSIAHELRGYFRLDRVLWTIEENTTGTLEQVFDVVNTPKTRSTEIQIVAYFDLTFNIIDRIVDTDPNLGGVFDTVELDGELYRHVDDPEPLDLTVNETSGALPY
jgi:hypothetical protein